MVGGGGGGWFPAITWSQPNYSFGYFVVGVVVVVGLWQFLHQGSLLKIPKMFWAVKMNEVCHIKKDSIHCIPGLVSSWLNTIVKSASNEEDTSWLSLVSIPNQWYSKFDF